MEARRSGGGDSLTAGKAQERKLPLRVKSVSEFRFEFWNTADTREAGTVPWISLLWRKKSPRREGASGIVPDNRLLSSDLEVVEENENEGSEERGPGAGMLLQGSEVHVHQLRGNGPRQLIVTQFSAM